MYRLCPLLSHKTSFQVTVMVLQNVHFGYDGRGREAGPEVGQAWMSSSRGDEVKLE